MSELTLYPESGAAAKLVQWAEAASAAQALAQQLCRTAFVPDTFRLTAGESEAAQRDNEIRIGNATAALLLGAELGLDPIASLRALYVIRGQVAIYARMKLALLLSRGHRVWTEFESDERIVVAGHRKDDAEHIQRVTWDVARAERAGFTRNELYRTNPRAMLFARASSELAQRLAPDVLAGIPEDTAEELGARLSVPEDTSARSVTVQLPVRSQSAPVRSLAPVTDVELPPVKSGAEEKRRKALARVEQERAEQVAAETGVSVEEKQEEQTIADPVQEEVLPLELPDEEPTISNGQRKIMHVLFNKLGWSQDTYREFTRQTLGRQLETTNELTITEADFIIKRLNELIARDDDSQEPASD
jgi:hypothetical protein